MQFQNRNQNQNQEQNKNGSSESEENGGKHSYQWRHQHRHQIQQGIENGTVALECNMSMKNGDVYVYSYVYQKGMTVELEEQNKHKLQIKVSAEFKEGKVIVLNIEKNTFQVKSSQQLRIKFDGMEINEENIEDVIVGEGTQAKYALALGEDGGQYIIYIPHFSEHVISIEVVGITESEAVSFISAAIGAAFSTIIILILIVVRIGKFKRE
jgi:hypothetical protein